MQSSFRSLLWLLAPFLWYAFVRINKLSSPAPAPCAHRGVAGAPLPAGVGAQWAVSAPPLGALDRDGAGFGEPPPSLLAPAAAPPPEGGGGGAPRRAGPPRAPGLPSPPLPSLELWQAVGGTAPLRGTCWTLRPQAPKGKDAPPDDFLYSVCLGDRIVQVQHPILGRAVLGTFAGWGDGGEGAGVQLYKGGSVCEGWGNREVTVALVCEKNAADAPVLWDVKEPTVCKYEMELRTAHAC
jgi:hypothetical protein